MRDGWPQSVAIQSTELVGQVHGRNSTKSNHNDGNSGPWLTNKIVEKFAKLISGQQTKRTAAVCDSLCQTALGVISYGKDNH